MLTGGVRGRTTIFDGQGFSQDPIVLRGGSYYEDKLGRREKVSGRRRRESGKQKERKEDKKEKKRRQRGIQVSVSRQA